MDTELTYLAWTLVLALAMIIGTAQFFTAANGLAYAAGPRDAPPPRHMTQTGARMERATKNLLETLPVAAAAILMAHVANRHNGYTAWGAALYFWGRIAHVPLYVFGVPYIRTVAFLASVLGILLVLAGLRWS